VIPGITDANQIEGEPVGRQVRMPIIIGVAIANGRANRTKMRTNATGSCSSNKTKTNTDGRSSVIVKRMTVTGKLSSDERRTNGIEKSNGNGKKTSAITILFSKEIGVMD
jgi:hypothetical protein